MEINKRRAQPLTSRYAYQPSLYRFRSRLIKLVYSIFLQEKYHIFLTQRHKCHKISITLHNACKSFHSQNFVLSNLDFLTSPPLRHIETIALEEVLLPPLITQQTKEYF